MSMSARITCDIGHFSNTRLSNCRLSILNEFRYIVLRYADLRHVVDQIGLCMGADWAKVVAREPRALGCAE